MNVTWSLPKKWDITGLFSAAVLAIVGASLATTGWDEDGLNAALRATARTSVVLFSMAFSASSLFAIRRTAVTTWLLRNRRYLGVSFAVSHFVHLGLIAVVASQYPEPFFADRGPGEFIGGGLAYVFIAAMTATSFDRSRRWLGEKRWKLLHTVGGYYILLVFTQRYLLSTIEDPFYIPLSVMTIAVFVVRGWRRLAKHRGFGHRPADIGSRS